eukprot:3831368-Prymnesium_polylepis.1
MRRLRPAQVCACLQQLVVCGVAYFALSDPGAPAQYAYRAIRFVGGSGAELCVAPCYGTQEAPTHKCESDCDCDGART